MKSVKLSREQKFKLLHEKIPYLDLAEVRRYKIPFHEALLLELKEGQFNSSFDFFSDIVEYDLKYSNDLTKNKLLLEKIFNDLKKSEHSSKEEEIEILTKLARSEEIPWLAEKIYLRAIEKIEVYGLNSSQSSVTAKYFYGKFLSERKEKFEVAVSLLDSAFDLSYGVEEWTIDEIQLYILISIPLCKSLISFSELIRSEDPQKSLKLAKKSLKITRKFKNDENVTLEVESLIEVGNCYYSINDEKTALAKYHYAFDLSELRGLQNFAFESLMKISECYKESNFEKFESTLIQAKDFAVLHSLPGSQGEIYLKLGKFWTSKEKPEEALKYLNDAAQIFKENEEGSKLNQVRLLSAPLIAQRSFNRLVDTILKSDKQIPGRNRQLEYLILWYDRKYSIHNPHHDFYKDQEPEEVDSFIEKFYNPDEITKVEDP